jgi:hypothetical protein
MASEIRLYDVPPDAPHSLCAFGSCRKAIAFVQGKELYSKVPVSLDHPDAVAENGRVVRAPSHFTDCAGANSFSKSGRKIR